jgi:hypothetical protein
MLWLLILTGVTLAFMLSAILLVRMIHSDSPERATGPTVLVTLVPMMLYAVATPIVGGFLMPDALRWMLYCVSFVGLGLLAMVVTFGAMGVLLKKTFEKMGPGATVYMAPMLLAILGIALSAAVMVVRWVIA